MSALTFFLKAMGYDDVPPTNNPVSRGIDYGVQIANVPCDNPERQAFDVAPGATVTVFSGTRSTSIDNTTSFDLTLSDVDPTVYRAKWVGGTAPVFRTDRSVDLTGITLTVTLNPNMSLGLSASSGTPFAAVVPGDVVLIPGVTTGDPAGPFNSLNEGYWVVLTATGSVLTLARDPGAVFSGIGEVVGPGITASQLMAFSAAGVQVGDTVDISAGFAASTQRSYDVTAVAPGWVEFRSTAPLGEESSVEPGAAGFIVYTSRKRFVGIVSDQEIVVRYNGDTGSTNRVEPLLAGTQGFEGSDHKFGSVWKLEIFNRSSVLARVKVASAE